VKYFNYPQKNLCHFFLFLAAWFLHLLSTGCGIPEEVHSSGKDEALQVLATTTHLADLAIQIGGNQIEVHALMNPGVDPHSYRASAQDIRRLHQADLILYHGLSLEGKMAQVLEGARHRGKNIFSPCVGLPTEKLIFAGGNKASIDPHLWFSPDLWLDCARALTYRLSQALPEQGDTFRKNFLSFESSVKEMDQWGRSILKAVPLEKRILITSHDAFQYFGKHFQVQVVGLQGINTMLEAGLADRTNLVNFIKRHKSPALFVESSVNPKALKEIAKESGAVIGGTLFSDALGMEEQTSVGPNGQIISTATWQGMMAHNLNTISKALGQDG